MMGIDMGVGDLMAVSFDSEKDPVLVNGRLLKSMAGFITNGKLSCRELRYDRISAAERQWTL